MQEAGVAGQCWRLGRRTCLIPRLCLTGGSEVQSSHKKGKIKIKVASKKTEKAHGQLPREASANAAERGWQGTLPFPHVPLPKSIRNQLRQLSGNELLTALALRSWALPSVHEAKGTEVGERHRPLRRGSRRHSKPPRLTLCLPGIAVISGLLSQLCLYTITQHPDLCPTLPLCKKFALQRGTVSASCTKLSDFGKYYNLPLFQRKEKTCSKERATEREGREKKNF